MVKKVSVIADDKSSICPGQRKSMVTNCYDYGITGVICMHSEEIWGYCEPIWKIGLGVSIFPLSVKDQNL